MINPQLAEEIKKQIQNGVAIEQIRVSLIANGWPEGDVDESVASCLEQNSNPAQVSTPKNKLPSAFSLLGSALRAYRQRAGVYWGIASVVVAVAGAGLMQISTLLSDFEAGSINPFVFWAISISIGAIIFLTYSWGQVALLYAIKGTSEGVGFVEAYRRSGKIVTSYWWVLILSGLITLGGILFFIIPGIIFAVWFFFAVYVLVDEGTKGLGALAKSREYVRGMWRAVLWRISFITLLSSVVSWALRTPLNIAGVLFHEEIGSFVVGLLITPLVVNYSYVLYLALKGIKGDAFIAAPARKHNVLFAFFGALGFTLAAVIIYIASSTDFIKTAAVEEFRDVSRKNDINQIAVGLELYKSEYDSYPERLDVISPTYLPELPLDPLTNTPYSYELMPDGEYRLCAVLETTGSPECRPQ